MEHRSDGVLEHWSDGVLVLQYWSDGVPETGGGLEECDRETDQFVEIIREPQNRLTFFWPKNGHWFGVMDGSAARGCWPSLARSCDLDLDSTDQFALKRPARSLNELDHRGPEDNRRQSSHPPLQYSSTPIANNPTLQYSSAPTLHRSDASILSVTRDGLNCKSRFATNSESVYTWDAE
jgi:hypothetical protein